MTMRGDGSRISVATLRRVGLCRIRTSVVPGESDEARAANGAVNPTRRTGALLAVEAGKTLLSDETGLDESGVKGSCLPIKADGDQNGHPLPARRRR